ncbi:MAG: S41 family peptidase [Pseudomonadota bacterium]|nr:S41 family peptidase [Pseudomonadota bacterium]
MKRRGFLGLSAATIATMASGNVLPQGSPNDLAAAVEKLAGLLANGYVYPAIGARYAAMLRHNLANGAYAGIIDTASLGARLTADLRAVSPDLHLRVVPASPVAGGRSGPAPMHEAPAHPDASGGPKPMAGPIRRTPIEDTAWLAKSIAYIRFTGFPGDPETVRTVADFMRAHIRATTLVIDCRYNGGGGLAEMNVMLPYLFARETLLVEMEMQQAIFAARGSPFDGEDGVRSAAAPAGMIRRAHWVTPVPDATPLRSAKIFYLVSGRTASAAEHLALALKRTKRAILIGETTAGANHFGDFQPIGAGLAVFLPVGRTIDPDTGKDWEGVGVAPDVAVPPAQALEEAMRRAGALA